MFVPVNHQMILCWKTLSGKQRERERGREKKKEKKNKEEFNSLINFWHWTEFKNEREKEMYPARNVSKRHQEQNI